MDETPTYEQLKEQVNSLETQLKHFSELKDEFKLNNLFLDMLFNTIPNPIFYKNRKGVYEKCNDAFSQTILGIEKERIIGKTLYELSDVVPKEYADIYTKKDEELFNNRGFQNYTTLVKCADNKDRYFDFYKAVFVQDDEVLGLVGIMLDVTEYKKATILLEEKNKQLKELSITDSLTKLNNRRFFEKIFEDKLNRLSRYNYRFALAIIDIDFFKTYNDKFGHVTGDEILIKVSKIIRETFNRKTDYTFRLGGEEFAVIYKTENKKDTLNLAEKLRKNIENAKIKTVNTSVSDYLTVSIGVADIITQNLDISTTRKAYNKVDQLLYEAKEKGRNQTVYRLI
jgi:diguanylate cyclase (GGDEF)-like protein/PAS domain S-box-containing protein